MSGSGDAAVFRNRLAGPWRPAGSLVCTAADAGDAREQEAAHLRVGATRWCLAETHTQNILGGRKNAWNNHFWLVSCMIRAAPRKAFVEGRVTLVHVSRPWVYTGTCAGDAAKSGAAESKLFVSVSKDLSKGGGGSAPRFLLRSPRIAPRDAAECCKHCSSVFLAINYAFGSALPCFVLLGSPADLLSGMLWYPAHCRSSPGKAFG